MRVIDLALKDLYQIVRDWKAALFLLVMPIVFTLLLGYVFRDAGGGGDACLPVGLLDLDSGGGGHLFRRVFCEESPKKEVVLDIVTSSHSARKTTSCSPSCRGPMAPS